MSEKKSATDNPDYRGLVKGMPDRKPCPCCGKDNLYIGHMSATSVGVHCHRYHDGCGLKIEVDMMGGEILDEKGYVKKEHRRAVAREAKESGNHFIALDRLMLKMAINRWNKRVK